MYQGLFLIFFALFAAEVRKEKLASSVSLDLKKAPQFLSPDLDTLYRKLKAISVFQSPVDGLTIKQKSNSILIALQSDELYVEGEMGVRESWYALLDQIEVAVIPELGTNFKIQFIGYANSTSNRENVSIAMTKSVYLFSASRAEWLLQYYQGKFHLKPNPNFSIAGGGAIPNGKRLELVITERD